MDIQFSCNVCGQGITIEESGAGMPVQCPHCGQELRVPLPPRQSKAISHPPPLPVMSKELNAITVLDGEKIKPSLNPFPVLTFVSLLLRVAGWVIVAGSLLSVVIGIGNLLTSEDSFKWGGIAVLVGIGSGVFGIIVVAIGELVGVAFAIEANTRRLADTAAGKAAK